MERPSEARRIGAQAAQSILQQSLIWGVQILKFVLVFVIDGIKSVLGTK